MYIKRILTVLVFIQVGVCFFAKMDIGLQYLLCGASLFGFMSASLWIQVIPSMTKKGKEEISSQAVDKKDVNQDMSSVNKARGKHDKFYKITGTVFFLIFLILFIVLFITQIVDRYPQMLMRLFKITRVAGLVILFGCALFFTYFYASKKKVNQEIRSLDNIEVVGVVAENILASMILIIY